VDGPADPVGLDQALALPQLVADLAPGDAGDPEPERQLGGGHDLRVDPADLAGDVDELLRARGGHPRSDDRLPTDDPQMTHR
jgi:hypothetical protein